MRCKRGLLGLAALGMAGCATVKSENVTKHLSEIVSVNDDAKPDRLEVTAITTKTGQVVYMKTEIDLNNDGTVNFSHVIEGMPNYIMDTVHIYNEKGEELPFCWENIKPFVKYYTDISGKRIIE